MISFSFGRYDKITGSSLRSHYMSSVVDHAFPFESSTQTRLQDAISSIVPLYAELATNGNQDFALKQLKAHLREHVVLERNTVWREMIGLERKGWSGRGGTGATTDLPVAAPSTKLLETTEIKTPVGRFRVPAWVNQQVIAGGLATLLFFVILSSQWFDRVEEQNCLALLAFVTIFWALEVSHSFLPFSHSEVRWLILSRLRRSFLFSSLHSSFLSSLSFSELSAQPMEKIDD
jgi:phosphate transporter